MITVLAVMTSLLVVILIVTLIYLLLPTKSYKRSLEQSSNSAELSSVTVPVRMEFLETLLMRSLRLDRSENEKSADSIKQPELELDVSERMAWQEPEQYNLPRLEETMRREQEELDRKIIQYQGLIAQTMDQYADDEEAVRLREFDAKESNRSDYSPQEPTNLEQET